MTITLEEILRHKRAQVAADKKRLPAERLQEQIAHLPACRDFYGTLTGRHPRGIHVIAEVKRASPSAGLIRPDFDPVPLARLYERLGADAVSVLTDEPFFQGRLEYLTRIKEAVRLPVLRKDFILDAYQVYEARAAGADAILLIAEALEPAQREDLLGLANALGLTVLLEVHDRQMMLEVQTLVQSAAWRYNLLGINNRNLRTMTVDLDTSLRLAELVPAKQELVSESGIRRRGDVERLMQAGFNSVLIGETLMRSRDIERTFKELFEKDG
ncbi:MAG: indole-3-glycerol phosphate synthase TrpC [Sedimentisphaerales bacterium]|nr:indole-3-glycerol phosphate synthase TrpC [Sedimentisphaerales bacterium]